jgi:L-lactate dehydrogenase complex protein LldG
MSTPNQDRATVLSRVRAALGVAAADSAREAAVADRLKRHPRGTVPARALQSPEACIALLEEMLAAQGAEVTRAKTPEVAVRAIADTLRAHGLPPLLRMGNDRLLLALPWEAAPELERRLGPAERQDRAALSRAVAAAAETGTLFLVSGADNPTTLAFLPETHFILIRAGDIGGCYEEAFDRLRAVYDTRHGEVPGRPSRLPRIKSGVAPQDDGRASNQARSCAWPRSVNMISGPSRTADIEQTIVRGAHGPKRLHVLVLG